MEAMLRNRGLLWAVAVLALVFWIATDLPWQLDDYDQAKQAFTSFEMVKEGHWLYQRTPHERIATKPPLVGWISAGIFEIGRSWDLAWRLPSLGAAIALAVMLYRAGQAGSAHGGLIAFGAFGLNLMTPRLASLVRTDMPLALVTFAVGVTIWGHIRGRHPWTFRSQAYLFALLTAGMMIKGPIIAAFLLPGIVAFQWWRRKSDSISAWFGWWPWIAATCVFLLWVVAGSKYVPGFYEQVVVREFFARFGETIHRPQPLYFYIPHLLHKFMPWSLIMLALAVAHWVRMRSERRHEAKPAMRRKMRPEMAWLVCWALGGIILMSLIPSKRVDRIFPVIPPLCLLLATQIANVVDDARFKQKPAYDPRVIRWALAALIFAVLYTGGYTAVKVSSGYRDHRDALVRFGRLVREHAQQQGWRYEVLDAPDEGLLLYCDKLRFVRPERAVDDWNNRRIDALVAPANLSKAIPDAPAATSDIQGRYLLLVR